MNLKDIESNMVPPNPLNAITSDSQNTASTRPQLPKLVVDYQYFEIKKFWCCTARTSLG